MTYWLIQYGRTETKGKYKVLTRTAYNDPGKAFYAGKEMHEAFTAPTYAGFAVKSETATIARCFKKGE